MLINLRNALMASGLPPWYKKNSYVVFGGQNSPCYIDLGVRWTEKSSLELKFRNTGFNSYPWDGIFGAMVGADSNSIMVRRAYNSNTYFQVWNYSTAAAGFRYSAKAEVLRFGKSYAEYGGEQKSMTHTLDTWTSTYNVWLGYVNRGNNAYGNFALYYLKLFNEENLIMNLLPRNNNGTIALYDTITRRDFYNQGSGAFQFGVDA